MAEAAPIGIQALRLRFCGSEIKVLENRPTKTLQARAIKEQKAKFFHSFLKKIYTNPIFFLIFTQKVRQKHSLRCPAQSPGERVHQIGPNIQLLHFPPLKQLSSEYLCQTLRTRYLYTYLSCCDIANLRLAIANGCLPG